MESVTAIFLKIIHFKSKSKSDLLNKCAQKKFNAILYKINNKKVKEMIKTAWERKEKKKIVKVRIIIKALF